MNVADDGIRIYANPWYDDRVIELWKITYTWIDCRAKCYENEHTSLTWIYLPWVKIWMEFVIILQKKML